MPCMRHQLLPLLLLPLLLAACGDRESTETSALSAQEMYEKSRALIKPNIEHEASDFAQSYEWLHRAAEAGWLQAQTDLGGLYMYGGKELRANGAEALKWFSRAAEQGSKEAEFYIGELYYKAISGVKGDNAEAIRHWRVAAEAGIEEAQQRLGAILAQEQKTFAEGLSWLRRAATEGSASGRAEAARDLGNIYARGKGGIVPDMAEAARWYSIAAEAGDVRAQHIYALMLLEGEPMAQDEKAGMFMLRRAASRDYLPAMAEFIRRLRNNPNATEEEQKEAEAWNERLAELLKKQREHGSAPQPAPQTVPGTAE